MPGHKGGAGADAGLRHAMGEAALTLDVPQGIEEIDVGPPPTPYERAETLAADRTARTRTWFLTNGATQGNHALCLALAPLGARDRRPAQLARLARRRPRAQRRRAALGGARVRRRARHGARRHARRRSRRRWPSAPATGAAFIVSPTYYGMAADVAGCAEAAHAAGAALVVDQAWGAHFGFHRDVPPSALQQGADAALTSTHKMVGSLTQSAMLHVADSGRIDVERLARTVRLTRSTSPNSLLLASLDAARRQIAIHGQDLLGRTVTAAAREARRSTPSRAAGSSARTWSAGRAWPPTTRCGS